MRPDDVAPQFGNPKFDQFARFFLYPSFLLAHRIRWQGAQNVPRTGGVIIAANHQSFYDPVIITMAAQRRIIYMGLDKYFAYPLLGTLMRAFDCIPVDQSARTSVAYARLVRMLRDGRLCGIFPEGGITLDGFVHAPWPGVGALVLDSGAPVVPVTIYGASRAWPRHRALPCPAPIQMCFGTPMTFDISCPAQNAHARRAAIARQVMLRVCDGFEKLGRPDMAETSRANVLSADDGRAAD